MPMGKSTIFNGCFSVVHLVLGGCNDPCFSALFLLPEPKACELFLADAVPVASEGSKVQILWMDLDPTFVIDSDRSW